MKIFKKLHKYICTKETKNNSNLMMFIIGAIFGPYHKHSPFNSSSSLTGDFMITMQLHHYLQSYKIAVLSFLKMS